MAPRNHRLAVAEDSWTLRLGAFLTLFGILAAHALLETARDALFLSNIPAERLPWVYLLIAVVALGIARLSHSGADKGRHRERLTAVLLLASLVTLAFWWWTDRSGPWVFYSLYVWSGVISSIIVVSFWLLLGELFTITEAKRFYASIATGGSIGALAGFGLATGLTFYIAADWLLLVSASFFAVSALGPALLLRPSGTTAPTTEAAKPSVAPSDSDAGSNSFSAGIAAIASHPYACRVAVLVGLSTLTLTFADFLFKSTIAHQVPADRLGTWFGGIYLALNLGSLGMLVFGVTPLIRRLGIHRSLAVLPAAMGLAAVGLLVGGALLPVLALKAADGTLRYSLQKTAQELLYLPMPSELRARVKSFIDIAGQAGAKAVASIAILLVVGLPSHDLLLAGGVLILASGWAWAAIEIRGAYLDVFRQTLSEGTIATRIDHPDLDLASLETLIRALNHPDPRHVLAALALFEERARVDLIPALILYHPAPAVVTRALDLFATSGRNDFLMVVENLLEHEDAGVRAGAARTLSATSPNRERLQQLADSDCPCIRVSAVSGLLVHGWIDESDASVEFERAVRDAEPEARLALANASKLAYSTLHREPLGQLSRDSDPEVRREAVRAIRASDDPWYTPQLVTLLADRMVREEVRLALLGRGDAALQALSRALEDSEVAIAVRRHIPRTLSRFATPAAAEILLQSLERPLPGMVRYKVLRGLAPLLRGPIAPLVDLAPVAREVESTIDRALQLLRWKIEIEEGHREDASRATSGGALLGELLCDKERLAIERIFQLLQLLHPEEDFRGILAGVDSGSRADQASGIELIENLLSPAMSRALLALLDSGPEATRWQRAVDLRRSVVPYAALLHELTEDASESVRAFALHHQSELGLTAADGSPADVDAERANPLARLLDQALGLVERLPEARMRRPLLSQPAPGDSRG